MLFFFPLYSTPANSRRSRKLGLDNVSQSVCNRNLHNQANVCVHQSNYWGLWLVHKTKTEHVCIITISMHIKYITRDDTATCSWQLLRIYIQASHSPCPYPGFSLPYYSYLRLHTIHIYICTHFDLHYFHSLVTNLSYLFL